MFTPLLLMTYGSSNLQGKWSRRISNEHRTVYYISSGRIYIYVFSMKGHYV